MWRWFELLSFKSEKEISLFKKETQSGKNPRDIKFLLAEEIVDRFHAVGDGKKCREAFLLRFQKGSLPTDIKELVINIEQDTIPLTNLLKNTKMTSSTSEAMRLIKQGGVKINSEKVLDEKFEVKKGSEAIYQVGKRKFLKINIKK
jgi:tyrosyl-tRNA synthetase